jgi:hypothetical protein
VPRHAAIESFGFADSEVNYGSDLMFISIIAMGCWDSSGAGWHPYPFVAVATFHHWNYSPWAGRCGG